MIDNQTRRMLLQRHRQSGFPGSIMDVFRAAEQGVDLIGQYMMQQQQQMQQQPQVASTPEQYEQGLRPAHQAGNTNQSMIFPNVPPNTPFNTVGMKAPINIQKFDEQGHLVKSYENVPPGVRNLPTGPQRGTVLETPAQMQSGGPSKEEQPSSLSRIGLGLLDRAQSYLEKDDRGAVSTEGLNRVVETIMNNPFSQALKEATRPIWAEAVFENMRPVPYPNASNIFFELESALKGKTNEPQRDSRGRYTISEEAYRRGLGLPVDSHYLKPSPYKPSQSSDPNQNYYRIVPEVLDREKIVRDFGDKPVGTRVVTDGLVISDYYRTRYKTPEAVKAEPMANFTISVGEDDKGKYVSLYDIYDLPGAANQIIRPFEIYDRIYVDSPREYTKMQSGGAGNGFWTPVGVSQHIANTKGGRGEQYFNMADTIAYHESAHTMDPNMLQIPNRKKGATKESMEKVGGKGAFQMEARSMPTYWRRMKNLSERAGQPLPDWYDPKITDARKLTFDQQKALHLISMLEHENTDMSGYGKGTTTTAEQWGRGWKGDTKSSSIRAFDVSREKAKKEGITRPQGSQNWPAPEGPKEPPKQEKQEKQETKAQSWYDWFKSFFDFEAGGPRKYQGAGALNFGQTGPDFETYGPKLRIDGETYQSSRGTGATRISTFEDGTQRPILLGAAEVYDEPISSVPEGYTPETKALADEGAAGVAARRNQAAGIGLAAAGDYFSTVQRYGVSAPLALAMGKQPNLSATPLLDRALGAQSPNAFPSEILGIQNPYGAVATDIATDPMAAFSLATLGRQGIKSAPYVARNFRDIRGAREFAKGYGYARKYRPSYSNIFSTESTDNAIRGLAEQHNTVTRGVTTDLAGMLPHRQKAVSNFLAEAGIDASKVGPGLDPIETRKAAEFFMTRYAGSTGFGRFGTKEFLSKSKPPANKGTLYTVNSPGSARGYTYGEGYVADLRRQGLDFTGPREDWLKTNDWKTVKEYQENIGDVILGERDFSGRTILTPQEKTETALNRFFQDRSPIVSSGPSGQLHDRTLRYGFLNDPLSRKRFGQILGEETNTVSRIRPELSEYQVENLASQRAGVRFGISDRLEAIDPTRFGRDGRSTNLRGFDIHRGSQSIFNLPEVQRSTSLYDRALHTLGRGIDAARYNYFKHSAQPKSDFRYLRERFFPKYSSGDTDPGYSHFIFTGPAGERAPLDIVNMRQVTGLSDEIGGRAGIVKGGRAHEGHVGKYSLNYKSGGPRKFQTAGFADRNYLPPIAQEIGRAGGFDAYQDQLSAAQSGRELNEAIAREEAREAERQKQLRESQGKIKPVRLAPPNAMAFMPPGLQYNQQAAGNYIAENPTSNPVSLTALGSYAAVAGPPAANRIGQSQVGRGIGKALNSKPVRYGFGALSGYDLANMGSWEGTGPDKLGRFGLNVLGLSGLRPGQGIRNLAYHTIDPIGYNPTINTPRKILRNIVDPVGRADRMANSALTNWGLAPGAIKRRLDIFGASLGRKPIYGTIQKNADGSFALTGDNVQLANLQGNVRNSIEAEKYARKLQSHERQVAALKAAGKHDEAAKLDRPGRESYLGAHYYGHGYNAVVNHGVPSARIMPDGRSRTTNLHDLSFNTMAGYELELSAPGMGGMADLRNIAGIGDSQKFFNLTRQGVMRDTWDLHPFTSTAFTEKFLKPFPESARRSIAGRLKNVEALSAIGGRPLKLRTPFTIENPLALEGRNSTITFPGVNERYTVGPYEGLVSGERHSIKLAEMEGRVSGSRYTLNNPFKLADSNYDVTIPLRTGLKKYQKGGGVNPYGSLNAQGNIVYSRAERDALFPNGTPAQQQRQQSKEATGTGVFESIRMAPGAGELIDFAETGYAYLTGKDFYGQPTNAGALGATALAGILVPNIVETPAKAAMKKLKNSPMAKDIEKGFDQLVEWFSSDDYKDRVRQAGLSPTVPDEAIRRLGQSDVSIVSPEFMGAEDGFARNPIMPGGTSKVAFKEGAKDVENLSVHEFGHKSDYADPLPSGSPIEGGNFSDIVPPPKPPKPKHMSADNYEYYSKPTEIRSRALETLMYMKRTGKSFDELVEMQKIGGSVRGRLPKGTQTMISMYNETPKGLRNFERYLNKMLGVSVAVGVGAAAAGEAGTE